MTLVPSGRNKADSLTCAAALVESASYQPLVIPPMCVSTVTVSCDKIKEKHRNMGHPGMKRALYFVRNGSS